FAAYPDGVLVSIVREPRAWYASARVQGGRDKNIDAGMERWRRNVERTLEGIELYGDRVVALTYEELVTDTEATMARLAARVAVPARADLHRQADPGELELRSGPPRRAHRPRGRLSGATGRRDAGAGGRAGQRRLRADPRRIGRALLTRGARATQVPRPGRPD